MSYCVVCDLSYRKGTYAIHRNTFSHHANMEHRRSMQNWYGGNGK